jgi:uncharacterized membrane protein
VTVSIPIRALFVACIALYPVCVYFGLQYLPPSFFGIALLVLLGMRFGVLLPEERPILLPILLLYVAYAAVAALADSKAMLLYYPVLVSFSLCGLFLNSIRIGEPLLLRVLRARGWAMSEHAAPYLHNLTLIWSGFFLVNGLIALWTATLSIEAWTLYNGFLSYVLVAILVAIEFVFRRWYKRRIGVDQA